MVPHETRRETAAGARLYDRDTAAVRPWRFMAWVGYAAAAWATIFAVAHIYWLFGGCAGFPVGDCQAAFRHPWFRIYDLVSAVLCVVGAALALALVQSWGKIIPRRLLLGAAWTGCVILAVRSVVSLIQDGLVIAGITKATHRWDPLMWYDLWFVAGTVLFIVATWGYQRSSRDPSAA